MLTLNTIDAHAAGEPLRLIVGGFPTPRGRTMLDKRQWAKQHADHLRRLLMLEPRGHENMCGALLTEPSTPGSHAGLLFMDNADYGAMSGHGVIAAAAIALQRGLLMPGGDGRTMVFDTPAGTIRATAHTASAGAAPSRITSVSFTNVPSFVLAPGIGVVVGGRRIRADVAFGGEFYAIVDSEAVGLPLDSSHLPELRRAGMQIKEAVERALTVAHPLEGRLQGIYGTVFTAPPVASADLRNVAVFADGAIDRSPCGTGTAAVMAVIDAMGLLSEDVPFVHESLMGTTFSGRVADRTLVGEYAAIVPEIHGAAWITGEHMFFIDEDDPLPAFRF